METASRRRERRAGSVMVAVGVLGVFVAFAGVVVGWQFLDRINSSTDESLTVTVQTIDAVDETIDLVDESLSTVVATADATGSTLDAVVESFDASTGVIDTVTGLADTVGPTLDNAAASLRSLQQLVGGVDSLLEDISNVPFAPSYDPDLALAPTVGALADDLAGLPATFDEASTELADFDDALDGLTVEIDRLSGDVSELGDQLDARDDVIEQYRRSVAAARAVAVDTQDGLDGDIGMLRILLVLGAISFGVGQIVPLWIGTRLLRRVDVVQTRAEP